MNETVPGGRRGMVVLALTAALAGCAEPAAEARSAGSADGTFASRFETTASLVLEENERVITVAPVVVADAGGYLVTDPQESQVRRYDAKGGLLGYFGSRGRGPGELLAPISSSRLSSGDFLVADLEAGRLHIFAGSGEFLESQDPQLFPLYGAVPLHGERVLLLGRSGMAPGANLLHVWNPGERRLERSFFPVPALRGENMDALALTLGWVSAAVRGDTIAAAFSLSDTLYHFATDGTAWGRVPIPVDLNLGALPAGGNPAELQASLAAVRRINDVHWLDDGSFLVQLVRSVGPDSDWGLVHMTAAGEPLFSLRESPRLLMTSGDRLYFRDPASEMPNEWVVARFRSGR